MADVPDDIQGSLFDPANLLVQGDELERQPELARTSGLPDFSGTAPPESPDPRLVQRFWAGKV